MIEDAELFCDEVEKFSNMKLLVKSDLQTLVSAAVNSLLKELFFSIVFSAILHAKNPMEYPLLFVF
jgi:hypothetical protein